ncbi:WG repeat-containing protein [Paludibaculum fermentans]|uniref:WG repeat-containing protein n=1 Tax=Paludibaculum fermentans TaxID=1473598 RepID=UPI003EB6C800
MRSPWIYAGVAGLLGATFLPHSAAQTPGDKEIWEKSKRSDTPLFRFVEHGRAGYINAQGQVVIPAQIRVLGDDNRDDFHMGIAAPGFGRSYYIDEHGRPLEPLANAATRIGPASEGLIRTYRIVDGARKEGFVDLRGQPVIPEQFDHVEDFSDGLAAVRVGKLWGYIDKTGAFAVTPQFLDAKPFSEGRARVIGEGPCSRLAVGGCLVSVEKLGVPAEAGQPPAKLPGCRFTFVDKQGSPLWAMSYGAAGDFSEGLAEVSEGGKSGFIDKSGALRIPLRYENAWPFSDGLARFQQGRNWGYLDKTGREVFPAQFEYADDFSEGAAVVGRLYGPLHYIDQQGRKLFGAEYTKASSFRLGLAHVCQGLNCAYIDRSGQPVFQYQSGR